MTPARAPSLREQALADQLGVTPPRQPDHDERSPRPLPQPSPAQVVALQAVREHPAVSLLLPTTPAPAMQPGDVARLRALAREAAARVLAGDPSGGQEDVLDALDRTVAEAAAGPTGTAVAVFASRSTTLVVPLGVEVRERVVVDPTFATRDLVRALHATPRHVVLVLTSREARLFDGVAGTLRPAVRSAFPLRDERPRSGGAAARPRAEQERTAAFHRTVDRALGTYLALHPAPLVLVGDERSLSAFRRTSSHLQRLAGALPANVATEPLPALAERIAPVLERYLLSRQREALDLVERRAGAQRVVSGMASCWLAARRERPEMLAVEQGLYYPARVSGDGDLLLPASDVEHPDVLDDAVDELIETVLDRGGWVALVDDGALAEHEGVALTLRDDR